MHKAALSHEGAHGWAAKGACRHADPELFFPVAPGGPALTQLAMAKDICAGCTVRTQCLEFALETGQDFGVWGGASEEERRLMRRERCRQRRRAAAPTS
jgi:WhiB family redox-sensing transcriptional regulator